MFNLLLDFYNRIPKVLPLAYDDSLSYYEVLCKLTKNVSELYEADKLIIEELGENNKKVDALGKDFDKTYVGKYLLGIKRKILAISGTLKDHASQLKDINLYVGEVDSTSGKIECSINGATFRLYINFSDLSLNGMITRLRGYSFSNDGLYKPKGSRDDNYFCHVYINGKKVISGDSDNIADYFHKGDYLESITVVTRMNADYFRIMHVDKSGIKIVRNYIPSTVAKISGSYWTDEVASTDMQYTVNTGGGALLLRNSFTDTESTTFISY